MNWIFSVKQQVAFSQRIIGAVDTDFKKEAWMSKSFIGLEINNSLPKHGAALFFSGDKTRENQKEMSS